MKIGTIIKKYRREQNITQEQLAEYLNVTAQAISRWETGVALPDITQVPALANIFNITADELLGVDIAARDSRIDEILEKITQTELTGRVNEALAIMRAAVKEYPNSHRLQYMLMHCIYNEKNHSTTDEEWEAHKANLREVISIGEKLLTECTDDELRHKVIWCMCISYPTLGEHDKAKAIAEKMPNSWISKESLLAYVCEGAEKHMYLRNKIIFDMQSMLECMAQLQFAHKDDIDVFSIDERIAILRKTLTILNIMFEDNNFGFYILHQTEINRHLAGHYTEKGEHQTALQHLLAAARHAITYDTRTEPANVYTCLLFKGDEVGSAGTVTPHNQSYILLEQVKKFSQFDALRGEVGFLEIVAELEKYAKADKNSPA